MKKPVRRVITQKLPGSPDVREKPRPVAKSKRQKEMRESVEEVAKRIEHNHGWMICGFDTSMSSLAGAAFSYDQITGKLKGPKFVLNRWSADVDYFSRLKDAARAHEMVLDLQSQLSVDMALDEIFICQEEAWPVGITVRKTSGYLRQQAEISGAFLGSLVRYGFQNIVQINSMRWRKLVADDLGITTHPTKWQSAELALRMNCSPSASGKFRAKEWALDGKISFPEKIPEYPDIIQRRKGKVPRPEGSRAKAIQCDDRYEALAMAMVLYGELKESLDGA